MSEKMLELNGVTKRFRIGSLLSGTSIQAVDRVSLSLPSDKPWICSIVGESGSGKTTLARMMLNLIEPSSGDIVIDGVPVKRYGKQLGKKQFYRDVQMIAQNPFSAYSARKPVDFYLINTARNLCGASSEAELEEHVRKVLLDVGIEYQQVKGKFINQFSGGELQRIAIARALLPHPKLIVADEPVAMIDASLRMNVVNLFRKLKDQFSTNFVYITHDLSTAYYVSDYIVILYRGRVIEFGRAREVLMNPAHPYTELLIDSIPKVGQKWDMNLKLPDFESAENQQQGCKFVGRCPYMQDACKTWTPEDIKLNDGHTVCCLKYR